MLERGMKPPSLESCRLRYCRIVFESCSYVRAGASDVGNAYTAVGLFHLLRGEFEGVRMGAKARDIQMRYVAADGVRKLKFRC